MIDSAFGVGRAERVVLARWFQKWWHSDQGKLLSGMERLLSEQDRLLQMAATLSRPQQLPERNRCSHRL